VSELEACCNSVFVSCCCEKLVADVRESPGGERPPLKANTKQRLGKTEKNSCVLRLQCVTQTVVVICSYGL
jgi:hypothetical protein